ncbi:MAG: hypothetical protein ACXQTE_00670 [Methanosarcinaceae archaeon]
MLNTKKNSNRGETIKQVIILIHIVLLILTVSSAGCLRPFIVNKDIIVVDFINNTNVTYIDYLENKYNITESSSLFKEGYVVSCDFSVPLDRADSILEQIRKEPQVRYADFQKAG